MFFRTAWTFEGLLETTSWPSAFPLVNANLGVSGEDTGVASDESASNFLELVNPWHIISGIL